MSEYIPVKYFAERAGVTIAAVYNRINNNTLDNYIKVEKGVKMVSDEALDLFTPRKPPKVDHDSIDNSNKADNADSMYKTLESTIALLSVQLEAKDKQLAEANDRLKEALALNHNNQVLLLDKKEEKLLEEPAPIPEPNKSLIEKLMFWK